MLKIIKDYNWIELLQSLINVKEAETVLQGAIRSSILNVIVKGFGYFRNVAIAILLGFNYQTDGFFMGLSLLGLFLIFADVFDFIGVPQLVRAREEGPDEFKKLSGLLFYFTLLLSISMVILPILFLNIRNKFDMLVRMWSYGIFFIGTINRSGIKELYPQ
ncbi:MAG: hypothetical protein NZ853_11335 [Leptospiraceae bacterium]|nr:hypothetical protein [Leptospiraceae bacterium]MDW7977153.1 hypothetical protein [Leptospiraceae bacterium]